MGPAVEIASMEEQPVGLGKSAEWCKPRFAHPIKADIITLGSSDLTVL